MSSETMSGIQPEPTIVPGAGLSPPDSTNARKEDGSDSELSELEDPTEELIAEPSYYDGTVPVFEPNMEDFIDFQRYMNAVNKYGMKSGIVKIRPPQEWKDALPEYDQMIKPIKLRDAIKQDIMGTGGTYRQANIVSQRSYNLPQWRSLCEQSDHQPPAKRGERRANQDKPKPAARTKAKRGAGRRKSRKNADDEDEEDGDNRLPTPRSPGGDSDNDKKGAATSVSARRLYNRKEAATRIDEEAFKDFDYRLHEEFSRERCEELERAYWKTLTYASPLYGADMVGTLFDDRTKNWNLSNLPNLLDAMGSKIPGVNTAYLYLGMWKATFAWHLEDVDLYSINYLHFGAPKQWYSISQGDARKFEAAMKNVWPADAKACDQFLRHKTFLISPSTLLNQYGIKVNKIVHHPGEFVVTFPYGYHSGYNLGYNCAEAVNFALDSWLDFGRIAKRCDCDQAQDSVWIDVRALERKINGEPTDDEFSEEEEDDDEEMVDLPSPPDSNGDVKMKRTTKRKRQSRGKDASDSKRIKIKFGTPKKEPCALCPYDVAGEPLLATDDGRQVHKICALYIPETEILNDSGKDIVVGMDKISRARFDLECKLCKSKKGACFQCSQGKCARSYHALCAAAGGVWVEQGETPVYGEDGTEYKTDAIEFSCRFHREKRPKKVDEESLEKDMQVFKAAKALEVGATAQFQYLGSTQYMAGHVVANNLSEHTLTINLLPLGDDIVEVEYKYLRLPEPADFRMVKPSEKAIPLPKTSLATSKRLAEDKPRKDDTFLPGYTWKEFECYNVPRNVAQVKIDLNKAEQIWHYLGKHSTDARAQYTGNLQKPVNDPRAHFLDSIPKPALAMTAKSSFSASYPNGKPNQNALNAARAVSRQSLPAQISFKNEKPYAYKPRQSTGQLSSHVSYTQGAPQPSAYSQPRSFYGSQYAASNEYSTGQFTRPADSRTASGYYQTQPIVYKHAASAKPQQTIAMTRMPILRPLVQYPPAVVLLVKKYPYLAIEVNYTRESYKSPYSSIGPGFMNGYEGDLVAHLRQKYPSTTPAPMKESVPATRPHGHASKPSWEPSPLNRQAWEPKQYGNEVNQSNKPESQTNYHAAASHDSGRHHLKNIVKQDEGLSMLPAPSASATQARYHDSARPSQYTADQPSSAAANQHASHTPYAPRLPLPQRASNDLSYPPNHSSQSYTSSQSRTQYDPTKATLPDPPSNYARTPWVPPSQRPYNIAQTAQTYHLPQPQESRPPVYAHQQYVPKQYAPPIPSAPSAAPFPQYQENSKAYASNASSHRLPSVKMMVDDILDLPPDSSGMVEKMLQNARRIAERGGG